MEKFADILKDLIEEKDVVYRDIEEVTEIPNNYFALYTAGTFYPTPKNAIKIAYYFDCTLDYLFGLNDDRKKKPLPNLHYNQEVFLVKYKKILDENNISHYKFSQNRFSESRIRAWRKGQVPGMEILVTIARELSCSLDWLLSE